MKTLSPISLGAALVLLVLLSACARKAPTGPFQMDLKVSPDNSSMTKPITFTLHIADAGQPVSSAEVTGTLTMKSMDMGKTEVKFSAQGNGDYQASMKEMDMSGPWTLAVDAAQGGVHTKKNFDFTVGD